MLSAVAVMARAQSDAANTATLPTSSSVAARSAQDRLAPGAAASGGGQFRKATGRPKRPRRGVGTLRAAGAITAAPRGVSSTGRAAGF